MNKNIFMTATGAMLALLLCGCSDDDFVKEPSVPPVSGDEILFGATSGGFTDVDPTTRTIYDVPAGSTFDNYTLLNIKWQYDIDQVRVYCPEGADGFRTADYTVKKATDASSGTSTGFLVKNGETGVRWGDTGETHNFYAFYSLDRIDEGLQTGTTVTATIPTGQEGGKLLTYNNDGNEDPNGTFKIITPDMTYCLMAGKGTWTPGTDKNVALTFTPIVTVLDVLVNGPKDVEFMNIVSVSVRSKSGKNIVGTFSYDLADNTYNFDATDKSETAASIATVQTIIDNNPVSLKKNEQLNVKFFLLPREISDGDLVVSVLTEGGVVYSKTISRTSTTPGGGDGILDAGLITRIKTPKLGGQEANNWMSQIPDNVLFSQLSLPGSKNSFAYNVDNSFNPNSGISRFYQALPPLGINATAENSTQFDEGVRVFDVQLNLLGDRDDATPVVYAGDVNVSPQITLNAVLNTLNRKIHESEPVTECAVVFLNFVNGESQGGTSSVSTWLSAVMNVLDTWNASNSNILTTMNANTTMLDMRGRIAVIFNLENSDNLPSGTAPVNYITGLSTSVQNTSIVDATFSSGAGVRIQNLHQCNNPNFKSTEAGDFGYREGGIGLVPYFITKANYDDPSVSCNLIETKYTLMKQINREIASSAGNLYINDLSGFCVTANEESTGYETFEYKEWREILGVYDWRPLGSNRWDDGHYYDYQKVRALPTKEYNGAQSGDRYLRNYNNVGTSYSDLGNGGNTCLFAQIFNEKAVDEYSSLVGSLRRPLGIVLMNFAGVGSVTTNSGNYSVQGIRLPGLIMMNNFMFPLKTGATNIESSSTVSYSKGGDVWD